jgi:hypothetical protein
MTIGTHTLDSRPNMSVHCQPFTNANISKYRGSSVIHVPNVSTRLLSYTCAEFLTVERVAALKKLI